MNHFNSLFLHKSGLRGRDDSARAPLSLTILEIFYKKNNEKTPSFETQFALSVHPFHN